MSGTTTWRHLLDFELRGHRFSINNQHGEWWFFVIAYVVDDRLGVVHRPGRG